MWNKAFKRIISKKVTSPIDSRMHTLRYLSGVVEPNLTMQEDLAFTVTYPQPLPHGHFDWELNFHAVEGSVAECDGQLSNSAPTQGYVPKLKRQMRADASDWSTTMMARFYTKGLDSGNYAAVQLTVDLRPGNDTPRVTIQYAASFDHSPDLAPGPVIESTK
jgi:hypothetical protein